MSSQAEKLHQLIQLIDEFDTFGKLNRDMSLLSVAIGTLRKDRSIAQDIYGLSGASSDGLGMLALSRILTEDYLHLLFLNENQESLAEQIDNFNAHPTIEHYVSLKAMEEWGFEFDESQDTKDLIAKVTAGFEKNKERFLRRRETENSFDPDDYYRTWTKVNLNELVKRSGLAVTDEGKRSLKFLTETYDSASSIIHHNSFIVWLLACQDKSVLADEYPDLALTISVITLSRMINLVMQISHAVVQDEELYAGQLNKLADIL